MFRRKKKKTDAAVVPTVVAPPQAVEQIRVMPQRFYVVSRRKANRTFVIFGLLFIVVGMLVVAALAIWKFGPLPGSRVPPQGTGTTAGPPVAAPTVVVSPTPVVLPTPALPTPEATPTPTSSPEPTPTPAVLSPASDEDNDGLTLNEERLYGTSPTNPDSDGDGYQDGAEVQNGYSPRAAKKTLVEDGLFQVAPIGTSGYQWAYPVSWVTSENVEDGTTRIKLDTRMGEYGVAVVAPNPNDLSLQEYIKQSGAAIDGRLTTGPAETPDLIEVSRNGLNGLMWLNPLQVYYSVDGGKSIVGLAYLAVSSGESPTFKRPSEWEFTHTFEAILLSFSKIR